MSLVKLPSFSRPSSARRDLLFWVEGPVQFSHADPERQHQIGRTTTTPTEAGRPSTSQHTKNTSLTSWRDRVIASIEEKHYKKSSQEKVRVVVISPWTESTDAKWRRYAQNIAFQHFLPIGQKEDYVVGGEEDVEPEPKIEGDIRVLPILNHIHDLQSVGASTTGDESRNLFAELQKRGEGGPNTESDAGGATGRSQLRNQSCATDTESSGVAENEEINFWNFIKFLKEELPRALAARTTAATGCDGALQEPAFFSKTAFLIQPCRAPDKNVDYAPAMDYGAVRYLTEDFFAANRDAVVLDGDDATAAGSPTARLWKSCSMTDSFARPGDTVVHQSLGSLERSLKLITSPRIFRIFSSAAGTTSTNTHLLHVFPLGHQQDQSLQAVVAAPKDFYNFEKNELLMNERVSSGAFPPQKPPANHGWAMREYERKQKEMKGIVEEPLKKTVPSWVYELTGTKPPPDEEEVLSSPDNKGAFPSIAGSAISSSTGRGGTSTNASKTRAGSTYHNSFSPPPPPGTGSTSPTRTRKAREPGMLLVHEAFPQDYQRKKVELKPRKDVIPVFRKKAKELAKIKSDFELENEKRAKFLKQKKKLLDKLGLELVLEGADKKNKLTSGSSTSGHNPMKRSSTLTTAGVDHEDQHLFNNMASTSNVSIAGAGTEDEIGVAVTAGGRRDEQAVHEITEDPQRQRILRDHAGKISSVGAAAKRELETSGKNKLTAQEPQESRRSSPPPPASPSYTPKKTHLTTDDRITEIFQTVLCKKQLDKTKGNFYRSDSRVGTWKELQPGDEAAPLKILPTASEMKATAANKRSQSPVVGKKSDTETTEDLKKFFEKNYEQRPFPMVQGAISGIDENYDFDTAVAVDSGFGIEDELSDSGDEQDAGRSNSKSKREGEPAKTRTTTRTTQKNNSLMKTPFKILETAFYPRVSEGSVRLVMVGKSFCGLVLLRRRNVLLRELKTEEGEKDWEIVWRLFSQHEQEVNLDLHGSGRGQQHQYTQGAAVKTTVATEIKRLDDTSSSYMTENLQQHYNWKLQRELQELRQAFVLDCKTGRVRLRSGGTTSASPAREEEYNYDINDQSREVLDGGLLQVEDSAVVQEVHQRRTTPKQGAEECSNCKNRNTTSITNAAFPLIWTADFLRDHHWQRQTTTNQGEYEDYGVNKAPPALPRRGGIYDHENAVDADAVVNDSNGNDVQVRKKWVLVKVNFTPDLRKILDLVDIDEEAWSGGDGDDPASISTARRFSSRRSEISAEFFARIVCECGLSTVKMSGSGNL
ncbi:unnamed protein product [Amoebophrya sp. A120]|nr:unnamed protein product [Amoebophrya sp. A120]|eukprot:GSA120T00025838001.1